MTILHPDDFFQHLKTLLNPLPEKVLIAVSGGRDSMVLSSLCANLSPDFEIREFIAVTIDHDLREGSGREAAQVSRWCKDMGLDHHILRWDHEEKNLQTGEKENSGVSTGLQARARSARYGLLIRAAVHHKCGAVLTAHSATDQAETVMMRLARGSGPRGLSGIHPVRAVAAGAGASCSLVRPLLSVTRQDITEFTRAQSIPYADDPSNENQDFERVRVRALLKDIEHGNQMMSANLLKTAARCRRSGAMMAERINGQFKKIGGVFHANGAISLDGARLELPDMDEMLARAVYAVGGGDHPPDEGASRLCAQNAMESGKATLGGALFIKKESRLWIVREPAAFFGRGKGRQGACAQEQNLQPGQARVWDRRFIIENLDPERTVHLVPSQNSNQSTLVEGPIEALQSLPAICVSGECDPKKQGDRGQGDRDMVGDNFQQNHGRGPGAYPAYIKVSSLLPERFEGHVIRFP